MSDGSFPNEAVDEQYAAQTQNQSTKLTNLSFDENPQNVSDLAQIIRQNTDLVTHEIFTRLPTLAVGQKLVVGFGEIHENGAHLTLINNIIHEAVQSGLKCAFAIEWPPNNIDIHLDEVASTKTTNHQAYKNMLNSSEHFALREKLSSDTTPVRTGDSRLNRTMLHQYMDNHNIPTVCADAARDWDLYIKNARRQQDLLQFDPRTNTAVLEAAQILGVQVQSPINAVQQFGMLSRNIYIANTVESFLDTSPDTDIVFIGSGRAHITGNENLKPEPSRYEHSLSVIFKTKTSHGFIGVPLYESHEDKLKNTPQPALSAPDILNTAPIDNIPFNVRNNSKSDIQESNYISSMSSHFTWIGETLSGASPTELYDQRKNALLQKLKDFRVEHNLVPQPEPNTSSQDSVHLENQP